MKNIEKTLDNRWRIKVNDRWNGRCAMCATRHGLECHHIIKRRFKSTRWDVRNGLLLCVEHHGMCEQHPQWADQWVVKKFGQHFLDDLKKQGRQIFQGNYEHWEEQLK